MCPQRRRLARLRETMKGNTNYCAIVFARRLTQSVCRRRRQMCIRLHVLSAAERQGAAELHLEQQLSIFYSRCFCAPFVSDSANRCRGEEERSFAFLAGVYS
jgi:hypothetical protein